MNLLHKLSICAMHISLISQERLLGSCIIVSVRLLNSLLYMRGFESCECEGLRHWQFLLLKFHLGLTPIPAP